MTEIQFQQVVAAYVNRPLDSFIQGEPAVNLLRVAINNAKQWAQRNMDFELCRTTVLVQCDVNAGGSLAAAVSSTDGTTSVMVNRIESAYLGYGTAGAVPTQYQYRPINLTSRRHITRRMQRHWDGIGCDTTTSNYPRFTTGIPPTCYRQGNQIFVGPLTQQLQQNGQPLWVGLDVLAWLPDYADQVQSDFFLDFCADWLLYRSIRELNFFLKDSNRVQVTSGLVDEAWKNLVQWNGSLMQDDDNDLN